MSQSLFQVALIVRDYDEARDFYVGKLGFEVKVDHSMPTGFRWLTVVPKGQSEPEIILMKLGSGSDFVKMKGGDAGKNPTQDLDAAAALLKKGMFSAGAFQTADCRKTHAELKAKGVEFLSQPKDQFYGVEAVFKDPFGNWFSLTQPKNY